jgi:hypothetical protein
MKAAGEKVDDVLTGASSRVPFGWTKEAFTRGACEDRLNASIKPLPAAAIVPADSPRDSFDCVCAKHGRAATSRVIAAKDKFESTVFFLMTCCLLLEILTRFANWREINKSFGA